MKNETLLLTPRNDEESLQILKIAQAFGIPFLVSTQPHGARLEREEGLLARIRERLPSVTRVVIVEIPGAEEEEELRDAGIEVVVIDHHRYEELDRTNEKSSLEQFLAYFGITNEQLAEKGFDAEMVTAVGAIDRGFLWELKKIGYTGERYQKALTYYRDLARELDAERMEREELAAKTAWKSRKEEGGIIVIEWPNNEPSIRDALSFIVAENYPDVPPTTYIRQGARRVYVQETEKARELHERFGGFTFGRDACWGYFAPDGDLPAKEDIFEVLLY
jgi:hypothetical protein